MTTAYRPFFLCLAAISIGAVGSADKRATAEETSPAGAEAVSVKAATWKQVKDFVGQQKGKVVVVDLWSTSCLPCMREFPHLVALQNHYRDQLVCVSFNLDYAGIKSKPPEYYQPRVEKFLTSRKAKLHNFISTEEAVEVFDQVGINSIPAVLVYGADGQLAKQFDETMLKDGRDDAFTYKADIIPFVQKLLK